MPWICRQSGRWHLPISSSSTSEQPVFTQHRHPASLPRHGYTKTVHAGKMETTFGLNDSVHANLVPKKVRGSTEPSWLQKGSNEPKPLLPSSTFFYRGVWLNWLLTLQPSQESRSQGLVVDQLTTCQQVQLYLPPPPRSPLVFPDDPSAKKPHIPIQEWQT